MMIEVRTTTEQDAAMLAELQKQAFAPLYEKYHDKSNPYLRGIEDVSRRLNKPQFRYFTILLDSEIVGGIFYKCQGTTPFADHLGNGVYYLQRVYIRPDRQGRKIAQNAILLCEHELPDAKCFFVDFPEDLLKNRKCYEAAGYRDTGKRMEAEPGLVLASFKKEL